ncbi:MAG TPA: site-specific integrase, partial [Candidatus Acidoferrales bacterium]|nr:site-specific integrase [Candidatus Acidoferrales bacterium]
YAAVLRKHVMPLPLMQKKMTAFESGDARGLYGYLCKEGVSPSVRSKIHVALHAAFETAVRSDVIGRNPFAYLSPKYEPSTMRAFTKDQARRFLEAARGDPLEALFVLAISTGARQGELLALRWEDVDLSNRSIAVRRNLSEVRGKLTVITPKAAGSRRNIALGDLAVRALRQRQRIAKREGHGSVYVFTTESGALIRKSNLRRRTYLPLLKKAKVPQIRFHDLRHSAATLALGANIHPKVVAEMLGHSRVGVTLQTYSHALPGMQAAAADTLSDLLDEQKTRGGRRR